MALEAFASELFVDFVEWGLTKHLFLQATKLQ